MEIKLYSSKAEDNRVNKASYLTLLDTINGTPAPPFSLQSPVFDIESTAKPTANYCYITEYSAYYFITDVQWMGGKVFRIFCNYDDLYTHNNDIRGLIAFVGRSYSHGTWDICDPLVQRYAEKKVTRIPPSTFPDGAYSSGANWKSSYMFPASNSKQVIVGLNATFFTKTGDNTKYWGSPISYFRMSFNDFVTLIQKAKLASESILGEFSGYDKLDDIIVSAVWSPYVAGLTGLDHYDKAWIGWDTNSGVGFDLNGDYIPLSQSRTERAWTFNLTHDATRKMEEFIPFTSYFIEALPLGKIVIDDGIVGAASTITLGYEIMPATGDTSVYLSAGANGLQYLGSMNINIPLDVVGTTSNNALTTMASALTSAVPAAVGGPMAIGMAASNAFTSVFQSLEPRAYSVASSMQYKYISDPVLVVEKYDVCEIDPQFYGKPCMDTWILSALSGFTQVERVHVEIAAPDFARKAIEQHLKEGVIL